jgi:putative phosphoesterase
MKLGVLSDTHGNLSLQERAAATLLQLLRAEALIHLGDDYADALELMTDVPIYAVPGMYETAWSDPRIPHRRIENIAGVIFLLSHTPTHDKHDRLQDVNPDAHPEHLHAQVLLHGHTHRASLTVRPDGLIVICPGHLKNVIDRGMPPTCALLEIQRGKLLAKIVDLEGNALEERCFILRNLPA